MDYTIGKLNSLNDFKDYIKSRHQFNLTTDSEYKCYSKAEYELDTYDLKSSYFSVSLKTKSNVRAIGFVRITPFCSCWPQQIRPCGEIRNFIKNHFINHNNVETQGIPMQDYFGDFGLLNPQFLLDDYSFEIGRLIFIERNIGLPILNNLVSYCLAVSLYANMKTAYGRIKKNHLSFYEKYYNVDFFTERPDLDYIPIQIKEDIYKAQESTIKMFSEFSRNESLVPLSFQNHKLATTNY